MNVRVCVRFSLREYQALAVVCHLWFSELLLMAVTVALCGKSSQQMLRKGCRFRSVTCWAFMFGCVILPGALVPKGVTKGSFWLCHRRTILICLVRGSYRSHFFLQNPFLLQRTFRETEFLHMLKVLYGIIKRMSENIFPKAFLRNNNVHLMIFMVHS